MSEETTVGNAINELLSLRRSWKGRWFGEKRILQLLELIGEQGGPEAVRTVALFIFASAQPIALAAAAAAQRIMLRLSCKDIPGFEKSLRGYGYYGERRARQQDVSRALELSESSWAALVILSFSYDGFVRQKSIEALRLLHEPKAIPFILIRANDWVREVRDEAKGAVFDLLVPEHAAIFIDSLPLCRRLVLGRAKDKEIWESIERLLSSGTCREVLISGLDSGDRDTKRICYQIALAGETVEEPITRRGLREGDPVVRVAVAEALLSHSSDLWGGESLEALLEDWYFPVRKRALASLACDSSERAEAEFFKHLCDTNAAIRSLCRFRLKQLAAERDKAFFAHWYKARLQAESVNATVGVVGGLAETGTENDAEILNPLLEHRSPRVRRAAIRALFRLAGNKHQDAFIQTLLYDQPSVSREAGLALSMLPVALDYAAVRRLIGEAKLLHAKLNLLSLINMRPKWEKLPLLLHMHWDADRAVRERAIGYLKTWVANFNRGHSKPTAEQLEEARTELRAVQHLIGQDFAGRLAFYLKGW